MLAGACVGGRWEGGWPGTSAEVMILERIRRFSLVASWSYGLDAHNQRRIFDWD